MMPKKKVFVSYARKDSTGAEVGELVRWLSGQEGIEIISDHLHPYRAPPQGWYTWMQQSIDDADIVLCICGEAFKKGFEKRGGGKGVAFEGDVITADLYESGGWNEKFHPILPEMGAHRYVPKKLRPWDNGIALAQREDILCLIRQEQPIAPPQAGSPNAQTRDDPQANEQVAKALSDEGYALEVQGKNWEAVDVYKDILHRFGEDESPTVRELVAKAMLNVGHILAAEDKGPSVRFNPIGPPSFYSTGHLSEQINLYDDIVRRFGNDESPAMRELVMQALSNKRHAEQEDKRRRREYENIMREYHDREREQREREQREREQKERWRREREQREREQREREQREQREREQREHMERVYKGFNSR